MDRFPEIAEPEFAHLPSIEDEAASSVDSFADWLAHGCFQSPAVDLLAVPRDTAGLQSWADGATIPELAAGLLYPSADVVWVASQELRCRWTEQYQDDRKSAAARQAQITARVLGQMVTA